MIFSSNLLSFSHQHVPHFYRCWRCFGGLKARGAAGFLVPAEIRGSRAMRRPSNILTADWGGQWSGCVCVNTRSPNIHMCTDNRQPHDHTDPMMSPFTSSTPELWSTCSRFAPRLGCSRVSGKSPGSDHFKTRESLFSICDEINRKKWLLEGGASICNPFSLFNQMSKMTLSTAFHLI